MLTVSDDTAAELFTKELGYQVSHSGSTEAGTAAVRADLTSHHLDVSQMVNLDGSGLDRGDRASCQLLLSVLELAGPTGALAQGLPVAGQTGTLIGRFNGTPAAGRLRAKTGTLSDVAALSGFITPDPKVRAGPELSQPVTFSILVNRESFVAGQDLIDQIALALAAYPDVPPIASIEPVGLPGPETR